MLPFTTETFLANFAHYNAAIWPAQIVAAVLGVLALFLAIRPRPGGGRAVALILAAFWLWTGAVYHAMFFAGINFLAPMFAILFVGQGLLFARIALRRGLAVRFERTLAGWAGLGLAVFALVGYPLIGWAAGHAWPGAPVFGVTPCPTVIFTWGILVLAAGRTPLSLTIIPLVWSVIGASAAWLLAMPEDLSLLVAAALGVALIVAKNRRARSDSGAA